MSWAWYDWPLTWLTNHRPSVLWHCWLGHVTRKTVSEMTYNVSSGTLNSAIPYHTCWLSSYCQSYVRSLAHSLFFNKTTVFLHSTWCDYSSGMGDTHFLVTRPVAPNSSDPVDYRSLGESRSRSTSRNFSIVLKQGGYVWHMFWRKVWWMLQERSGTNVSVRAFMPKEDI